MTEETFQRAKELHDEIVRLEELTRATATLSADNISRVVIDAQPTIVIKTDFAQLKEVAEQCAHQLGTVLVNQLLQTRKMFDEL